MWPQRPGGSLIEHPTEVALTIALAAALIKALDLALALLARHRNSRNGRNGQTQAATKLDVAQSEARILAELKDVANGLHSRVTDVSERVARLEGKTG